jgi:CxxC-x17-CxxC domain-containing protein
MPDKQKLEEKILICKDCGDKLIWTEGEQQFFIDKGLKNIPKRCKSCAAAYKSKLREKHPMHWIKCKKCKKKSEVPFEPKSDDVFCEECFKKEIIKRDEKIAEAGLTLPS